MRLRLITTVAALSAMATVVMTLINFPLPYFPPFLKYDPSEVFALVGGLALGPVAGLLIVALKDLLHMIVRGEFTIVSHLANFVSGGTLVVVSSLLYRSVLGRYRGLAVLIGSLAMAAVMVPANYLVFLPYHGITGQHALTTAVLAATPFNFVKALLSGVMGLAVHAPVQAYLRQRPGMTQPAVSHRS